MHPVVSTGQRAAESNAAFDIMDIGAAADSQTLALQTGIFFIGLQQSLHQQGLGGNVMRSKHMAAGADLKTALVKVLFDHLADVFLGGADGAAAVKLAFKTSQIKLQLAEHQGQLAGDLIFNVDTHGSTVVVTEGEQAGQVANGLLPAALSQRQVGQQAHHGDLSVLAGLGRGGVGTDAQRMNANQTIFFAGSKLYAGLFLMFGTGSLDVGQSHTFHPGVAFTSDNIGGGAAVDGSDTGQSLVLFPLGAEHRLVTALFDVDDGIFGIGREAQGRCSFFLQIILQILTAGFFCAADDHAATLGQVGIDLPGGLHSPQSHHSRTLVVGRTAAVDTAILNGALIGREGPAATLADHVQMGQDTQIGFLVVQLGGDHIVVKVFGGKAHFLCQLLAFHQCLIRAFAKGHTGLGFLPLALDADQPINVSQDLILFIGKISFDFFSVHLFQTPSKSKGGVYSSFADLRSCAKPEKPNSAARSATFLYS